MLPSIYQLFDVVRVPFPFSDLSQRKRRPALVISSGSAFNAESGHTVVAMITSALHSTFPLDFEFKHPSHAGLPKTSTLRMKIFTIDTQLIEKKLGALHPADQKAAQQSLCRLMPVLSKEKS